MSGMRRSTKRRPHTRKGALSGESTMRYIQLRGSTYNSQNITGKTSRRRTPLAMASAEPIEIMVAALTTTTLKATSATMSSILGNTSTGCSSASGRHLASRRRIRKCSPKPTAAMPAVHSADDTAPSHLEPIARGEAVYTPRENQSQEGRQYILRVRTNCKRGGSIYSA
eukprot:1195701-Prorocentrum_minimum.AAC.1